jgi:uncharacterized membrane protein
VSNERAGIGSTAGAAALALAVVAFIVLSNWLTLHAAGQPWAIAALLAPIWLVSLVAALRQRHVAGLIALCAVAALVAATVAHGGIGDVTRLYLLEHAGIHLALCFVFARTLRGGPSASELSLIGRFAERLHGSITPPMAAYTWRVTAAWSIYFVSMALLSVAVFVFGSWVAWSLLANLVTPVAIGTLFVGEHMLRYRLHPEFERVTLLDGVRAYRGAGEPSGRSAVNSGFPGARVSAVPAERSGNAGAEAVADGSERAPNRVR